MDDQVQLDPNTTTAFDFIWVAASGRGTIIKIDSDYEDADGVASLTDGAVLGEYRTAPSGQPTNPSRTTVDLQGNVWVGNRDQAAGGLGSAAKVLLDPVGTTSNGIWNDLSNGGAAGTFNALPWSNAGGADTNGGTSTASDTAIAQYIRTAGTNARSIAVDANNDVWIGGFGDKDHQKYDGDTGAALSPVLNNGVGGYGAVIDGNGILWTSDWANSRIGRIDTKTDTVLAPVATGGPSYGLAVDTDGNIWNSHFFNNSISKLDSNGALLFTVASGGSDSRGVAVTADDGVGYDSIWIANSGTNTVTRLRADTGAVLATIPVGSTPTGVSVDSNGKVWVTNFGSNSTMRIDPATDTVEPTVDLGPGATPYNYSDMTGSVVSSITKPTGLWSYVLDTGDDANRFDSILWNTEDEGEIPDGTTLTVELRVAATEAGLGSATFEAYESGDLIGIFGRFAEIRATFTRDSGIEATSVLSDLTLLTSSQDARVPLPASALLLLAGAGGLAGLRRLRRRV